MMLRPVLRAVALFVPLALAMATLGLAVLSACNTAAYRGRDGYDAACPTFVEYPCRAAPIGEGPPGCTPEEDAHGLAAQIPGDASYPYPCTLIIPVPIADDQGQCTIAGSCRCAKGAGIPDGGIGWICVESHF